MSRASVKRIGRVIFVAVVSNDYMARWPRGIQIGVALIAFAILWSAGWKCWESWHIWVPLDIPVSLAKGHIRTAPFRVNVPGNYLIAIVLDRGQGDDRDRCFIGDECGGPPFAAYSWSISDRGRVVTHGNSVAYRRYFDESMVPGREVGTFKTGKGEYVLDLDMLHDSSLFNDSAPHLVISEDGSQHWALKDKVADAYFLSAICGLAGLLSILSSAVRWRRERRAFLAKHTFMNPPPPGRSVPLPRPVSLGWLLILVGVAIYLPFSHWMATRTFVAFNKPVSLAPGHLRTGPFAINLNEPYTIWLDCDQQQQGGECSSYSVLSSSWILYKGIHAVDSSGKEPVQDSYLMGFQREAGTYDLDLTILKDSSCLNAFHPRLRIFTSREPYDLFASMVYVFCALSVGVGSTLLLLARQRLRAVPVLRKPKESKRPFWGLPAFGFFAANVYMVLALTMMVLQIIDHEAPRGLRVRVIRPGALAAPSPGIQPLLVRLQLTTRDKRPDLYVGSQRMAWEDFDAFLKKEIVRRPPNWPVYFEGDPEMDWQDAARAIDRIRGLNADVVLITNKSTRATQRPAR
jgi:hypothetical protein